MFKGKKLYVSLVFCFANLAAQSTPRPEMPGELGKSADSMRGILNGKPDVRDTQEYHGQFHQTLPTPDDVLQDPVLQIQTYDSWDELKRSHEASSAANLAATYSVWNVKGSFGSDASDAFKRGKHASYFLMHYRVVLGKWQFTPDRVIGIARNVEEFIKTYGDSYVSSVTMGVDYEFVFKFNDLGAEEKRAFEQGVSLAVRYGPSSVQGHTSIRDAYNHVKRKQAIEVYLYGTSVPPATSVSDALKMIDDVENEIESKTFRSLAIRDEFTPYWQAPVDTPFKEQVRSAKGPVIEKFAKIDRLLDDLQVLNRRRMFVGEYTDTLSADHVLVGQAIDRMLSVKRDFIDNPTGKNPQQERTMKEAEDLIVRLKGNPIAGVKPASEIAFERPMTQFRFRIKQTDELLKSASNGGYVRPPQPDDMRNKPLGFKVDFNGEGTVPAVDLEHLGITYRLGVRYGTRSMSRYVIPFDMFGHGDSGRQSWAQYPSFVCHIDQGPSECSASDRGRRWLQGLQYVDVGLIGRWANVYTLKTCIQSRGGPGAKTICTVGGSTEVKPPASERGGYVSCISLNLQLLPEYRYKSDIADEAALPRQSSCSFSP